MSRKPEGEEHRVPVAVALLDKEEKVQLLKVRCTRVTTNVLVQQMIKAPLALLDKEEQEQLLKLRCMTLHHDIWKYC